MRVVLAACIGSGTHTSMQHYWAAALFKPCWLLVVAAALIHWCRRKKTPDRFRARMLIQALLAARINICARTLMHIIGLQHSSNRAGCSQSQQHSHANAASTARLSILSVPSCKQRSHIKAAILSCGTLQVVLAARISGTHTSIQHN